MRGAAGAVARERHPWNVGFRWHDHDGPFTTITSEHARQYDELGFFVVEDAFDAATIAALDDAIAPGEAKARAFLAGMPDGRFSVEEMGRAGHTEPAPQIIAELENTFVLTRAQLETVRDSST